MARKVGAKKQNAGSSNNITAEKIITSSEKNIGKFNIKLSFSNGVVFNYQDGKFNAKLNGEYINIDGEYLISTDEGIEVN